MLRSFPYWARAAALALTCQLSFIASWGHAAYPRVGGRGALKFDGDNDYVTLGNNPSLRLSGDLTVSAWVKLGPNTAGQHLGILGKMTVRSAYPLGFRLARVDKNRFRFAIGGPYALRELPSTMTYTDSEWHHVAGTMRGKDMYLYVDGVGLRQSTSLPLYVGESGVAFCVGKEHIEENWDYFEGWIDEVCLYNRALSEGEMQAALSTRPSTSDPSLVGYWAFDEADGQTVTDGSGRGNHGYLGGSAGTDPSDPQRVAGPVTSYTLTVSASPQGAGSVTRSPNKTTYSAAERVTLTATPTAGYEFKSWAGDLSGSANPAALTMDSNKSVTAVFQLRQYSLTTRVSPQSGGSVTRFPNKTTYAPGAKVTLTATPAAGHEFKHWAGDLSGSANPATLTMNSNKSVTAVFQLRQYSLTTRVSPQSGGSVTRFPNKTTYAPGAKVTLTATPAAGHEFKHWADDLSGSANPATLTMDSNKLVMAVFQLRQYSLTTSVSPHSGGSVTRSPDKTTYAPGEKVTLTVMPAAGYEFQDWAGDLSGSTNPATLTMDSNKSVMANFTGSSIIYVDQEALGDQWGTSWEHAFHSLQAALAVAASESEIRLAKGLYRPDKDLDHPLGTGDRWATFQLKDGVTIKGGYVGANAPDPDIRDIKRYETVLSGDLNSDDGLEFVNSEDNSYHVVTASGTDATAVLDGVIITGGNANGLGEDSLGAGIYNSDGSATVIDCTFRANHAMSEGGGLHNQGDMTLYGCTFRGNSAMFGGSMFSQDSAPRLVNCTFSGNDAMIEGAGIYDDSGNPELVNCVFCANTTNGKGGGMLSTGTTSPFLINCTFYGNSADFGGGAVWASSYVTLVNCIVWDDSGIGEGQVFGDDVVVIYSDIQGSEWAGTHNIHLGPLFVDPDGPDEILGTEDDNLRLQSGSPCVDTGRNAWIPNDILTDLEGKERISNGVVDMGAYEFDGP